MTTSILAKWTVNDYHQMIEAGILAERRVELLAGEIVEMSPEKPIHSITNVKLAEHLRGLLGSRAKIWEAHPITLPDSEPEPDIAVVRSPFERYNARHPYPEDIYLIIEIANTTLAKDLEEKKPIYARAGLAEYWVIDLRGRKVKVFRQPEGNSYLNEAEITEGAISPLAFPEVSLEFERIFS